MPRTKLPDQNQKLDIIEHVNQDHAEELLLLTQTFSDYTHAEKAQIIDLFQEGILIEVCEADEKKEAFIAFQLQGELEEQILYLVYLAMSKQGKGLGGGRKQFFEVVSQKMITENIIRLEIKSPAPLPENKPAYAYWFMLKTLKKLPPNPIQEKENGFFGQMFSRGFLWLMKYLSTARRKKIIHRMSQGGRYYTLRQSWRSSDKALFADRGSIDIFLHGKTAGSEWARKLNTGDIIYSQAELADKHEHLTTGKALLIADETAYPALAGIIEDWQNPTPPTVILLSAAASEQQYFHDEDFPTGSEVVRIICPSKNQGERVLKVLENLPLISCTWGACEYNLARQIRHFLRNQYQLTGNNNHIKGYWRRQRDS